jgi:hypothetical protein
MPAGLRRGHGPGAVPPAPGGRDQRRGKQEGQQEQDVVDALEDVMEAVADHVTDRGRLAAIDDLECLVVGVDDAGGRDLASRVGEDRGRRRPAPG